MDTNNPMKGFDLPVTENLTADGAREAISKVTADVIGCESHPFTNEHHPQHASFVTAMTKLHEVEGAGKLDPVAQACQDAMTEQADKKMARAVKTAGVVKHLSDKGYTGVPAVTVNDPPWRGEIYSLQLLLENDNHQRLKNDMNQHIVHAKYLGLKIPPEIAGKVSAYNMAKDVTDADKHAEDVMAQGILEFLAAAHGEQDRKIAKALQPSGNPPYVCQAY